MTLSHPPCAPEHPGRTSTFRRAGSIILMAASLLCLSASPSPAQDGSGAMGGQIGAAAAPSGGQANALPVVAPGQAVVTGFSGSLPPAQVALGADPGDQTVLDLNGASARVVDLSTIAGQGPAPFIAAPKPFTVTAAQVGQVFGVALDNAVPPNVYLAASSAYGLPLAAANGAHVRQGGPGVRFMPGLWGPGSGGPGSVWKVDGRTGAVTPFATIAGSRAAALGGLGFDPASNSLYVADRGSGLIHRLDMSGADRGVFDHGVTGRPAAGLSAVVDGGQAPSPASPALDSRDPLTWGYAPIERRPFGLAVHGGRLYYSVAAGLQVWSVGIGLDGSFAADARMEIELPTADAAAVEVSKITFDRDGRMILAERAAPSGAFDMEALAAEGAGRVLRYAATGAAPGGLPAWQQVPDDYAIGIPPAQRNGDGGAALGWTYDKSGKIEPGSCGRYLWTTGERLRQSPDAALAATLAKAGPLDVDGLQGDRLDAVRPANAPPLASPFIDYDDRFDDPAARGRMGDVAIAAPCAAVRHAGAGGDMGWGAWGFGFGGWMVPDWFLGFLDVEVIVDFGNPTGGPLQCPADQQKPAIQCCPFGKHPDGAGKCVSICPNGASDGPSLFACAFGIDPSTTGGSQVRCLDGSTPDPKANLMQACLGTSPIFAAADCQSGFDHVTQPNGQVLCLPNAHYADCPNGEQLSSIDGACHKLCKSGGIAFNAHQCCPAGALVSGTGQCCPPGETPDAKGVCRTKPVLPVCPAGIKHNKFGACCGFGLDVGADGLCSFPTCTAPNVRTHGRCCSPQDMQPGGQCAKQVCAAGTTPLLGGGQCCPTDQVYAEMDATFCCPYPTTNGRCLPPPKTGCPQPYLRVNATVITGAKGGSQGDPGGNQGGGQCCRQGHVTSTGTCCPVGILPGGDGIAVCPVQQPPCAADEVSVAGVCRPKTPPPAVKCTAGYLEVNGACCLRSRVSADGKSCGATQTPPPAQPCPNGDPRPADGICPPVIKEMPVCPGGTKFDGRRCEPIPGVPPPSPPSPPPPPQPQVPCPRGEERLPDGRCAIVATPPVCPPGTRFDGRACEPIIVPPPPPPPKLPPCPRGEARLPDGLCPAERQTTCPAGTQFDGRRCEPVGRATCGPGTHPGPGGCVADGPPPRGRDNDPPQRPPVPRPPIVEGGPPHRDDPVPTHRESPTERVPPRVAPPVERVPPRTPEHVAPRGAVPEKPSDNRPKIEIH